jgi:hypothetical protein
VPVATALGEEAADDGAAEPLLEGGVDELEPELQPAIARVPAASATTPA